MSARRCIFDVETRSPADLRKVGAHAYAEHPLTELLVMRWTWRGQGVESKQVLEWRPGWGDTPELLELLEHVRQRGVMVAHNAQFEWSIWNLCLRGTHDLGWPELTVQQMDDTMARAAAMALPQGLEQLCRVLQLPVQKDVAGHRLMLLMCRPKPQALAKGQLIYFEDEDRLARLSEYCAADVEAEVLLDGLLPPLSERERALWELDQAINNRGVCLDVDSIRLAEDLAAQATEVCNVQMRSLTGGAVSSVTNPIALRDWLHSRGITAPDCREETVDDLLTRLDLPADVRQALQLRSDAGKASVAKLSAMRHAVSLDGRARGLLSYAGAGRTRRWAGRRVQPQNMFRPQLEQCEIEAVIDNLGAPYVQLAIETFHGPVIKALASCLRGFIVAAPGHQLLAADLSNIEGRVGAWFGGEQWKLDAFRAFDEGHGPDLYKVAYAKAFGVDPTTLGKGRERQLGKVMELASQFQGSLGAYTRMAPAGGAVVIQDGAEPPPGAELVLTTSEVYRMVDAWRDAHPGIVDYWYELDRMAQHACLHPGQPISKGNGLIKFCRTKQFLIMQLPSKGVLAYYKPKVQQVERPNGSRRLQLTYEGMNSYTRKWERMSTYGGKLFENAVQATARDIQAAAMLRVEAAGLPIVLHVHDEIVTEIEPGQATPEDLARLMSETEDWAQGLPVAAAGWVGHRYRKD